MLETQTPSAGPHTTNHVHAPPPPKSQHPFLSSSRKVLPPPNHNTLFFHSLAVPYQPLHSTQHPFLSFSCSTLAEITYWAAPALLRALSRRPLHFSTAPISRSASTLVLGELANGSIKAQTVSAVVAATSLSDYNSVSLLLAGSGQYLEEAPTCRLLSPFCVSVVGGLDICIVLGLCLRREVSVDRWTQGSQVAAPFPGWNWMLKRELESTGGLSYYIDSNRIVHVLGKLHPRMVIDMLKKTGIHAVIRKVYSENHYYRNKPLVIHGFNGYHGYYYNGYGYMPHGRLMDYYWDYLLQNWHYHHYSYY